MVSKSQIKLITSLAQKKYRRRQGLFVVEGLKSIREFIAANFVVQNLYTTRETFNVVSNKIQQVNEEELKKISFLKTPQKALAVFKIPEVKKIESAQFYLALDGVRDPGNLGTIIRLCDWFGLPGLVCSEDTVDCFNPKVVQASMGSLARINVLYTGLAKHLETSRLPVFGAFMDGENVYNSELPEQGILVMGNEANGISEEITPLITRKISIPRFGETQETESLNVATASAILISEFKRAGFTH